MAQKKKQVEFFKQTAPAKKVVKKVETGEILDGVDKIEYLIAQYWKPVTAGIAAIAVIVILLIIVQAVRAEADRELRGRFADADDIAKLEAVIAESPAHPSAYDARLRLARLHADAKAYGKAYSVLSDAAVMPELDPFLSLQAKILAAYQLENDNKAAEAVQEFSAVATAANATEVQRCEAVFAAARLSLKQNKAADAERFLNSLNYNQQNSNLWLQQCAALKQQSGKK